MSVRITFKRLTHSPTHSLVTKHKASSSQTQNQESAKNAVNLTEDGTNLVTRMIDCLYSGSYTDFSLEADGQDWKSPHQLHAAMYALGDKWDIAVIKETALLNFNKHAAKFGSSDLLGLIDSIPIVYSSTPDSERTLRDATVDKVKATPLRYLGDDVKEPFQKVLVEVPEFSWDLHRHWMSGA